MTSKTILIVDDEPGILLGLGDELAAEGHRVLTATDGEEGLRMIRQEHPDVVVLDIMLPSINGFEILKQLRMEGNRVPILMLTAKGEEIDKILGLEFGADDYITKPFSLREVVARIHAQLRRVEEYAAQQQADLLQFSDVSLDFRRFQARKGEREVELTPREFQIMKLFAERPQEVISRDEFLDKIWGEEVYVTNRSVDNQISSLRRKLETDPEHPRHILSVRGVGYKFVPSKQ